MLGELTLAGNTKDIMKFYVPIPKKKARQYKQKPDLLVPEVMRLATHKGPKLDHIVFNSPDGKDYIAKPGVDVFVGGRFVDIGDGTVYDTKTSHSLIKAKGRFVDIGDGTVLDIKFSLMWAKKDNGKDIHWGSAKIYCNNYSIGGYTDWRLPTQDELAELYAAGIRYNKSWHIAIIQITACCPWASEGGSFQARVFNFDGHRDRYYHSARNTRVLPVRDYK